MTKSLYAEFTVISGNEARVRQLVREFTEVVRAEPGNLSFTAHILESDPASYFVYEVYRDEEAFAAHLAAPAGAEFNAQLAPLVIDGGSRLTMLAELDA